MRGAGGGRKKLKQGVLDESFDLQPGQAISRVVSLRGSNVIEVEDDSKTRTLCLLPAKFNKILWIRKGGFVVVEEGEREKVLGSGNKVTGIICQVLFEEQIRALKRSPAWPAAFKESELMPKSHREVIDSKDNNTRDSNDDGSSTEDEDLPPLESNQNRRVVENDFDESSSDEDETG